MPWIILLDKNCPGILSPALIQCLTILAMKGIQILRANIVSYFNSTLQNSALCKMGFSGMGFLALKKRSKLCVRLIRSVSIQPRTNVLTWKVPSFDYWRPLQPSNSLPRGIATYCLELSGQYPPIQPRIRRRGDALLSEWIHSAPRFRNACS